MKTKTILPIDLLALGEKDSYHLLVTGMVDGCSYNLLIDTGASHTIFDKGLMLQAPDIETGDLKIESAGIQAGDLNSSFGFIKDFQLGDLKRKDWTVVTIDLEHVNQLYSRFTDKHVSGLIGSDFLLKYNATIDYRKKELTLRNIRKN